MSFIHTLPLRPSLSLSHTHSLSPCPVWQDLAAQVKAFPGSRPKKVEQLRALVSSRPDLASFAPLSLPLDPGVMVTGIDATTVHIFKVLPLAKYISVFVCARFCVLVVEETKGLQWM